MRIIPFYLLLFTGVFISLFRPIWIILVYPFREYGTRVVYSYFYNANEQSPLASKIIKGGDLSTICLSNSEIKRAYAGIIWYKFIYYVIWVWFDDSTPTGVYKPKDVVLSVYKGNRITRLVNYYSCTIDSYPTKVQQVGYTTPSKSSYIVSLFLVWVTRDNNFIQHRWRRFVSEEVTLNKYWVPDLYTETKDTEYKLKLPKMIAKLY